MFAYRSKLHSSSRTTLFDHTTIKEAERDKIRKSHFTRNKGHERKLEKDLEIKLKCEKDNRIHRLIIQIRGQH